MLTAKKKRSRADTHSDRINSAIKKLGGEEESNRILVEWESHKRAQVNSDRRKREADGFIRGLIVGHSLSREEATKLFKIGRLRYDRLRNMNPNQPIPARRPPDHKVTSEDKELIRLVLKGENYEPGYPCSHRSTPLYMEDPSVTITSIHKKYKIECEERSLKCLSFETFRKIVKFIIPTLHLGKTKTDSCNACMSLELQIKDPQTSEELRRELIAAKAVHLKDAINMRKVIKEIIKQVRDTVAPGDPDLYEEPVYIPTCFSDPFDRLNRPFVVDQQDGQLGRDEEGVEQGQLGHVEDDYGGQLASDGEGDDEGGQLGRDEEGDDTGGNDLFYENLGGEEVEETDIVADNDDEEARPAPRKLRVSVQDFGSGIAMPRYGADRPNTDYYANNITLHNFNVVDSHTGQCTIYYYDERAGAKDGSCMSSLRWEDQKRFIIENKDNLPTAEFKIMDNCVGQNKSNTTHQFSMLVSILLYPDGVNDVYFRVGHSHNTSDMKTAHANKAMAKKNLYTSNQVILEINKMKGLTGQLIDERSGVFLDWAVFLEKHFPKMDAGFTRFFLFEFKDGVCHYKEVGFDGQIRTVKSRTFCQNPAALRKIILRELFNLSPTADSVEMVKAKLRLPPLPTRRISKKKVDNMVILYPQIPRCHRWYYPEGNAFTDEPHTALRLRAAQAAQENGGNLDCEDNDLNNVENVVDECQSRRRPGRPPNAAPIERNQPGIHRFLTPASSSPVPPTCSRSAPPGSTRPVTTALPAHSFAEWLRLRADQTAQENEENQVWDWGENDLNNENSVEESQPRRRPGRPTNAPPTERNQPGIHRFFTPASSRPVPPACSRPATTRSSRPAPSYAEWLDGDVQSESGSEDEVQVVAKKSKHCVIDSSNDDNLENFGDGVEECSDSPADDRDDWHDGDAGEGSSSYAVDMNHNNGRVIMRLKRS